MEHLKTIYISLALASAAKTAQDEAASLKEELKSMHEWADETEADNAKKVSLLKDVVHMQNSMMELLSAVPSSTPALEAPTTPTRCRRKRRC
jgi:hypothetical protein